MIVWSGFTGREERDWKGLQRLSFPSPEERGRHCEAAAVVWKPHPLLRTAAGDWLQHSPGRGNPTSSWGRIVERCAPLKAAPDQEELCGTTSPKEEVQLRKEEKDGKGRALGQPNVERRKRESDASCSCWCPAHPSDSAETGDTVECPCHIEVCWIKGRTVAPVREPTAIIDSRACAGDRVVEQWDPVKLWERTSASGESVASPRIILTASRVAIIAPESTKEAAYCASRVTDAHKRKETPWRTAEWRDAFGQDPCYSPLKGTARVLQRHLGPQRQPSVRNHKSD